MDKEKKDGILNGSDFQHILEYHPRWLIKWGISIVAIIVLAIVISLLFIKEPEAVSSDFLLYQSINPAKADSTDVKDKGLICAFDLDANGKNKISHLKKLNLSLIFGIDKQAVTADLKNIEYMNLYDKFRIFSVIDDTSAEKLRVTLLNKDTLKGRVQIIINDKTLFERFFTSTTP